MAALDQLRQWPVGSASAAVIRRGELPVTTGDVRQVHPWASLTKPLVALAVLVAVEEQTLDLDEPAGPPGATLRHLLAHASGLAPDDDRVLAAPGSRRIYSNRGFELVGSLLAERSGMDMADYVRQAVLLPLGMEAATLAPGASPASGAAGTLADLAILAGELQAPTLVGAATMAGAASVCFPGLAGVVPGFGRHDPCDWGLGFELRGAKVPHWTGHTNSPGTYGHFGRAGGFVWIDPVAGVACCSLSDEPFGSWAVEAWPRLSDAVLGEAT